MVDSGASVNVSQVVWELQTGTVWWCNLSQGSKRKTAPRIRKETDLVENLRSDETVWFPCCGRDETFPECKLFVWKRSWDTSRKGILLEVWWWTRAVDQKVVCTSSRRRRWTHVYELMDAQRKLVSTRWRLHRENSWVQADGFSENWCVQAEGFSENRCVQADGF